MLKKWHIGVALGALMAIGFSAGANADEPYIPLISKGFQHQFWQAVKLGAEQEATPIDDIGECTSRQGQQDHRQRRGHLD